MGTRTFECPACAGRMRVWFGAGEEIVPPRFCQHCGYCAEPMQQQLTMPAIGKGAAASVDGYYRATEEMAEHRARLAQEQFGLSAEETSGLKVTDMRDGLREGDIAAPPVNNIVTQTMARINAIQPGVVDMVGAHQVAQLQHGSHPAHGGRDAYAGLRAGQMIRAKHAAAGGVVTETPSLETQSPNYRSPVGR